MFRFSLLLPTRGRPKLVNRVFKSIIDTAHCIEDIEIVLCLDDDDLESQEISNENLSIKKVILPRGSTMGSLNRACFEVSLGRYLMLINDDVIIRTKDWDKVIANVLATYRDDIALIHVNDLLFRESLCTFPLLSRKACLEIGICPAEYRKYRIDDHIYDTYQMLACLGHRRIAYLADVVFEHDQKIRSQQTLAGQVFKSGENEIYISNKEIIEFDKRIFDEKVEERKQNALKLAYLIDQGIYERKQSVYKNLLNNIKDPNTYRRNDFVRKMKLTQSDLGVAETTTVSVVIPNIRKEELKKCISLIKKYVANYDTMIFDGSDEILNELNKSSKPDGIKESIKKAFLNKMIIWIRSNKTAVRISKITINLIEKFFSKYYNLPHWVRRVFDGLLYKLIRIYRAIQHRISSLGE